MENCRTQITIQTTPIGLMPDKLDPFVPKSKSSLTQRIKRLGTWKNIFTTIQSHKVKEDTNNWNWSNYINLLTGRGKVMSFMQGISWGKKKFISFIPNFNPI